MLSGSKHRAWRAGATSGQAERQRGPQLPLVATVMLSLCLSRSCGSWPPPRAPLPRCGTGLCSAAGASSDAAGVFAAAGGLSSSGRFPARTACWWHRVLSEHADHTGSACRGVLGRSSSRQLTFAHWVCAAECRMCRGAVGVCTWSACMFLYLVSFVINSESRVPAHLVPHRRDPGIHHIPAIIAESSSAFSAECRVAATASMQLPGGIAHTHGTWHTNGCTPVA
jgi:hypothetical protein